MRGYLDTSGKLTPEYSAKCVLRTVLDLNLPLRDRPVYIDYKGEELPY